MPVNPPPPYKIGPPEDFYQTEINVSIANIVWARVLARQEHTHSEDENSGNEDAQMDVRAY